MARIASLAHVHRTTFAGQAANLWKLGGADPDFVLYEFFYTGSDRNYGRYSNPEFDRLVDEQSVTLDPEARREIAWDAAEIALRDHARVLTVYQAHQAILNKDVRGYMPPVASQYYGAWNRYDMVWLNR